VFESKAKARDLCARGRRQLSRTPPSLVDGASVVQWAGLLVVDAAASESLVCGRLSHRLRVLSVDPQIPQLARYLRRRDACHPHTHLDTIRCNKKGKGSPYSITVRRVPDLIPVLGSQPAGDVSHKPNGRLLLFSTGPAVTPATLKKAATNSAAW